MNTNLNGPNLNHLTCNVLSYAVMTTTWCIISLSIYSSHCAIFVGLYNKAADIKYVYMFLQPIVYFLKE